MRFFKRKKEPTERPLRDKVAGKIAAVILKLQTGFSNSMTKRFSTMKTGTIKLWVILFSLVSGGLSIYFFVAALTAQPAPPVHIDRIRMPMHVNSDAAEQMDHQIDISVYDRIQAYKKYMDSSGKKIPASLADSIKLIEEMYLSQQK